MRYLRCLGMLAMIGAVLTTATASALEQPGLIDTVRSNKSYEDTIEHLKWQFGTYDLTITHAMSYHDIASAAKRNVPRSALFEVSRRQWLEEVLNTDAAAAIWLPLRIFVVTAADGSVSISYLSPTSAATASGRADARVIELFKRLDGKFRTLIETAAR